METDVTQSLGLFRLIHGLFPDMSAQVGFTLRGRNPDVLTCIANLSNDEVFTPPEFANRT